MTDSPAVASLGFYGKLPSHGDFLRRRVSDEFVRAWDAWLQQCLVASRSALGDRWLDVYLTSPVWRFVGAAGAIGPAPVLGLMVPSVDRVGRYFHLTLVADLPRDVDLVSAATGFETFFDHAQQLVIETLGAEQVDFEQFDQAVTSLGAELESLCDPPKVLLDPAAEAILREDSGPIQFAIGLPTQMPSVFGQVLSQRLCRLYEPLVIWWTDGSAAVEPTCLIGKGLPDSEAFAALLDGSWQPHWRSIPARIESAGGSIEPVPLVDDPTPPRYRSAAATDVGCVRKVNQDSLLERADVGLWAVADGLGGHSDGEVASRMVCDALADFVPDASFEQMIDAAGERLCQVNDHLVRTARRQGASVSGSTVVALLTRGTRCAVLWVGDSRVYRVRDGNLEQLTKDHTLSVDSDGLTSGPSNVITRAVGGEATLELDLFRDRVRVGDRFLLCSDGLTKTISQSEIETWMGQPDIHASVEGLIAATLGKGAPDNVTVLVVEAYS